MTADTHVVIDEVHECGVESEMLLLALRIALQRQSHVFKVFARSSGQ